MQTRAIDFLNCEEKCEWKESFDSLWLANGYNVDGKVAGTNYGFAC